MNFSLIVEIEGDSFTNAGPTPRIGVWARLGREPYHGMRSRSRSIVQLGGDLTIGFRPFRLAWNGRWNIGGPR